MKHESTAAVQHHTVIQLIAISYEHLPSKSDEQPDRKKGPTSPINLPLAPAIRKNWKMENTPPTHPNPKPNRYSKTLAKRKRRIQTGSKRYKTEESTGGYLQRPTVAAEDWGRGGGGRRGMRRSDGEPAKAEGKGLLDWVALEAAGARSGSSTPERPLERPKYFFLHFGAARSGSAQHRHGGAFAAAALAAVRRSARAVGRRSTRAQARRDRALGGRLCPRLVCSAPVWFASY